MNGVTRGAIPLDEELSPFPNTSAHIEFYKKFKREADEFDNDFIKKYDDEANTTLIFAGLFSAVASAFIVDVQSQLQPDYTQMSYALLKILASSSLGNIPTGLDAAFPQWTGPDPAIVQVQAILYSSLAASLLAAFIAMLGKQWLNRFARVEMTGSIADRTRNRARRLDGMVTWHFHLVMECLPVMLQFALLLLGYALSNYLFSINKVVASVIIGFTAFGVLFYLLILSAATLSYNCPFQIPLSLIVRSMIRFDNQHRKYLRRSRKWFRRMFSFSWKQKRLRPRPPGSHPPGNPNKAASTITGDSIVLAMASPPHQPHFSFDKSVWEGYALDSDSIIRLFGISTDPDVILAITKFIPEIVWHAGVRTTPLERLYDILLECFDRSSGRLVVIPKLRNDAYLAAKALLHLAIQRKCIGNGSDRALFQSISNRHQVIGSKHYEGDSDLKSTLSIIDHVFHKFEPISWPNFFPTTTHLAWMSHILLYRAWDAHSEGGPLPDDVRQFVLHTLRLDPPPRAPIVTDCLFIIGLTLGIKFHIDDLLVIDKGHEKNNQTSRIYKKLGETIRNPNATTTEIDRALEAMELIAPLLENEIATKSYRLFHVVMQAPVTGTYTEWKKWQAARFTMRGAYKWENFLPWVEDPKDILSFLDHHFDLATRYGENQDGPIQDALCALAYASGPVTIRALKRFDTTKPSFVQGIRYVYQGNRPFQLRNAAFIFLPLISDRWFNTPDPIMEPDHMKSFCVGWASAVNSIEHTGDVKKAALAVLFGMINSPHWRPHIVSDQWNLLEYFTSVPDDSQPLKRCLDNPGLMDAVLEVGNPVVMVHWLTVLWLNYKGLTPDAREKLEARTKEVSQGEKKADLDGCLSAMDSELGKAQDALTKYATWFAGPAGMSLRTKIDNIRQAKAALVTLMSGS